MVSKIRPDRETASVSRHPKAGREQPPRAVLRLAALLLVFDTFVLWALVFHGSQGP
jgi:hypothetical protein